MFCVELKSEIHFLVSGSIPKFGGETKKVKPLQRLISPCTHQHVGTECWASSIASAYRKMDPDLNSAQKIQ